MSGNLKNLLYALAACVLSGCTSVANLLGGHIGKDYEPATHVKPQEMLAVEEVEGRVPAAIEVFNQPAFKVRPRLHVIRDPAQFVPNLGVKWRDLPAAWPSLEPRVPDEGYSGLWQPPDLYVSVISGRDFRTLYAHERAHSFFERGTGHVERFHAIERFLLTGRTE